MTDTRYVYGARCTWHGPISAVGSRDTILSANDSIDGPSEHTMTLPCCPHCSGMLYEFDQKASFDYMVEQFDKKHPGYIEFVEWLGTYVRCYPNPVVAADAYKEATGKDVNLGT